MMFRAKHVLQNKEGRFYFINFLYIYTFFGTQNTDAHNFGKGCRSDLKTWQA